jgi:pyruvate/2-oxoglutarate dehydrogenase complex dihydrolipoamide acyltransferase (E2) component
MCILPGKRPSKGKRKSDDNEKPARKLKKRKVVMASVPLDTTIINIDDDSDGVPPSNPVPPNASSLSSPIFIASSSSQGSEQSTLATCSTAFTSGGLAESSSAASPSASPVLDRFVSNREPAPSSKPATTNKPASEPATSNEPASEPATSNELASEPAASNEPVSEPAASNELGLDLEKQGTVSNEASGRITRRSHRANVLYELSVSVHPKLTHHSTAPVWSFPLLHRRSLSLPTPQRHRNKIILQTTEFEKPT